MTNHAVFELVNPTEMEGPLIIRDIGHSMGCLSVTNDAEHVVFMLTFKGSMGQLPPGRRLLYYDSDGRLDEILIEGGKFAGFKVWNGPEPA